MTITWIVRTGDRIVQLPDGTDEVGARRMASQWSAETRQPVEIWYSVDDSEPQRLGPECRAKVRACDALCRDVEDDRDRLYALLGEVADALELALSAPIPTEKREACVRILARAKEALS